MIDRRHFFLIAFFWKEATTPGAPYRFFERVREKKRYVILRNRLFRHTHTTHDKLFFGMSQYPFPDFSIQKTPILKGCICDVKSEDTTITLKELLSAAWKHILQPTNHEQKQCSLPLIWCISLQEQSADEHKKRHAFFHQWGMCRFSALYIVERPNMARYKQPPYNFTARGKFGIWSSHQNIARLMMSHNKQRCLVLEHDAEMSFAFSQTPWELWVVLQRLADSLGMLPLDWEMFMLGYFPIEGKQLLLPHDDDDDTVRMWQVKALMLHAYILSECGIRRLGESWYSTLPKEMDIDKYASMYFSQYAISPQLMVQNGIEQSSNTSNFQSKLKNKITENGMTTAITLHRHAVNYLHRDFEWIVLELLPLLCGLLLLLCLGFFLLYRSTFSQKQVRDIGQNGHVDPPPT